MPSSASRDRTAWWRGLSDSERRAVQQRLTEASRQAAAKRRRGDLPPAGGEKAIDHHVVQAFRAALAYFGTVEDALECVMNTADEVYQQWLEDHPPVVVS